MDYATLKGLRPGQFEDAADGYRKTSHMASQAKDDIDQQITVKMRQSLSGDATDAAVAQLRKLSKNFHYTQVECGLAGTALTALASELRAAKRKLDAAVDDARAEGFTVESDGSVSYPAGGKKEHGKPPAGGTATADAPTKEPSTPLDTRGEANSLADSVSRQAANADPNPHAAKAHAIAVRIAAAVKEATEADHKWAPQLRKLKADDDLSVSSADWADAQQDTRGTAKDAGAYMAQHVKSPPKHGSPRDNAAWWKDLSKEDRDAYVSMHPASVGAMDGLPADVRDEANRAVLAEKRGEYKTRLAEVPPEPNKWMPRAPGAPKVRNPNWEKWNNKYSAEKARLQDALRGMNGIQQRFNRTGQEGIPEAYLLGFDPEGKGDGKVIMANGNPDKADRTGVFVPGTGTNLKTIGDPLPGGNLQRGEQLWKESHRLSPHQNLSTITWFDYNAPDDVHNATSPGYAEDGAPTLHHYLEGNRTSHEQATGQSGHTTVIGHSYGSTLTGQAAKDAQHHGSHLPADDVIAAGSPGMQARRADNLGVDPHHVWAMKAGGNDAIVREGGRAVGLGDNGVIPTDPAFGARIMKSDAESHSNYWDEESLSLRNQTAVISGRYSRVELAPPPPDQPPYPPG